MFVTGFMLRTIAKRGYDGIGTNIADSYSEVRNITDADSDGYTVDGTSLNLLIVHQNIYA